MPTIEFLAEIKFLKDRVWVLRNEIDCAISELERTDCNETTRIEFALTALKEVLQETSDEVKK